MCACRIEPGGREGTLAHGKPTAPKLEVSEEGDGDTQESSSGRQQASHPLPVPGTARHSPTRHVLEAGLTFSVSNLPDDNLGV